MARYVSKNIYINLDYLGEASLKRAGYKIKDCKDWIFRQLHYWNIPLEVYNNNSDFVYFDRLMSNQKAVKSLKNKLSSISEVKISKMISKWDFLKEYDMEYEIVRRGGSSHFTKNKEGKNKYKIVIDLVSILKHAFMFDFQDYDINMSLDQVLEELDNWEVNYKLVTLLAEFIYNHEYFHYIQLKNGENSSLKNWISDLANQHKRVITEAKASSMCLKELRYEINAYKYALKKIKNKRDYKICYKFMEFATVCNALIFMDYLLYERIILVNHVNFNYSFGVYDMFSTTKEDAINHLRRYNKRA